MNKTYKLELLTDKEVEQLRNCEDIKFVLTEHHPIHQSGQTDDFGNQIQEPEYNYTVIVEILPSTEEREKKVETFISSLTLPGKDHRIDRFSREYNYLKEELGINLEYKRRKRPTTIGESLNEIEEQWLAESLGCRDHTND